MPPVDPAPRSHGAAGNNGGRSFGPAKAAVDWSAFLRRVERKRRTLDRGPGSNVTLPADYYARATYASFRLDGLDVSYEEVQVALGCGPDRPGLLRSRQSMRMRNHAAILHHIENALRENTPLTTDGVVRWYTGVSSGLSTTSLDQAAIDRLAEVVRRMNSPQLRLQAALQEIAGTHVKLLAEALVPSFNGILARLLLRYHLGRCKFPAVVFDAQLDARAYGADAMVHRLVELLEDTYDELLGKK